MILAPLLLALQAPAAVPTDPVAFDLRCMMLAGQLREVEDASLRQAAETMSYFYFGRADARVGNGDMAALMLREATAMGGADQQAMLQACGSEMEARGQRLAEAGRRLEQQMEPASPQGR